MLFCSFNYKTFVRSRTNYILAVCTIFLNVIILLVNIYIIRNGFRPFEGGLNFSIVLMISNVFIFPAVATFFKTLRSKFIMLALNILGMVVAVLGAFLAFLLMTIQC
ncbi:hypothetical protein FB551_1969 [Chryseobacterium aquifrigidense]|uniref:Uncharacterized protein n=1 Tax=Chryseobacterium aquifrigidense TaxID=558021 RepID=A0A543EL70_9FLAO|nr:hypothetical protein FB551_1969 [Chryseobacterium aquifrigidense]